MSIRSRKRTWYIRLRNSFSVDWTCLHRDTRKPSGAEDPWARFVLVKCQAEDGRPLDLVLTPKEAHALGRRLMNRAEHVQRTNAEHKNGWADDTTAADVAAITQF